MTAIAGTGKQREGALDSISESMLDAYLIAKPCPVRPNAMHLGGFPGTPPDVLPDPFPPPDPEPDGPGFPEPDPDPGPLDPVPKPVPVNDNHY